MAEQHPASGGADQSEDPGNFSPAISSPGNGTSTPAPSSETQGAVPAAVAPHPGSQSLVKPVFYVPDEIVVCVGAEDITVDLNAVSQQAEAFNAVRQARQRTEGKAGKDAHDVAGTGDGSGNGAKEAVLSFEDFAPGVQVFKNVVKYLEAIAAEERAAAAAAGELGVPAGVLKVNPGAFHLELDTDNVCNYLEAAAILRCPRLLRDSVLAPAAKELSSRRVLALLERILQITSRAEGAEGPSAPEPSARRDSPSYKVVESDGDASIDIEEEYVQGGVGGDGQEDGTAHEQVMQAFCQVIQRLCARLDAVDFKLTSALAAGSTWASLEVLRAYRIKVENLGRMNYALQSMTSTVKSFFYEEDKSQQQLKQEWKEHHFALHVFRKQIIESTLNSKNSSLKASAEKAMAGDGDYEVVPNDEDDYQEVLMQKPQASVLAEDDIPEAICDGVTDTTLAGLSGFVAYCDPLQTPPVLAAAMVRSLLLVSQVERARTLFESVFVRSRKVQAMVTGAAIPVDFLGSVRMHRVASIVLRRILARYESLPRGEFCHLVEDVLLKDFHDVSHCIELVLVNSLIQDIVVYCRVRTRSVGHLEDKLPENENSEAVGGSGGPVSPGDAELLRVRKVGEALFAAAFVLHNGFLPLTEEPDRKGENWPAGPLGVAECPWDSGDLDLPLLRHVPGSEDALHLLRRVLLRGLFRRQRAEIENDVPTTVRLWELGRWPTCRDAVLISEAFGFVGNCWRTLHDAKAKATWGDDGKDGRANWVADEEDLYQMFSDLEFWRLQPKELLTPWVPPQLLACHIAARCKLLDEQQRAVFEDNRNNLVEINRLRLIVTQLFAKLEVVEKRSLQSSQKQAEVIQTVRSLR
uniref:Uncharacterized protein n=1 Tax=Alexandrium monilatum TaxID=311494 RepID=A0A7S4PYX1_9DINO